MKPARLLFVVVLLILYGVARPQAPNVRAQPGPPLLVIVSAALAGGDIGLGVLRNAFEGYPTDFGGKRLVPFNHAFASGERIWFDEIVLGMDQDEAARFWVDQRVRTGYQPPRTLPSADLALRVVASLPGGITYLAMTPESVPQSLRALTIDGKAATHPAYPLRAE